MVDGVLRTEGLTVGMLGVCRVRIMVLAKEGWVVDPLEGGRTGIKEGSTVEGGKLPPEDGITVGEKIEYPKKEDNIHILHKNKAMN